MRFILNNSDGNPVYKVEPYNDCCWELYEYKRVEEKKDGKKTGRYGYKWTSLGKYASDLNGDHGAWNKLVEHAMKRSDIEVSDIKAYKKIADDLIRMIKEVEVVA